MAKSGKLAILAGGGPAPGINSVIGAATIRAAISGVEVVGLVDGFRWIMEGDLSKTVPLSIKTVAGIHFRGGSVIGVSRADPTREPHRMETVVSALARLGVDRLITIGGDDTALSAMRLSQHAQGRLAIVHVPKTIDNDIELTSGSASFGFETARHVGVGIVKDLQVDARTTSRWYFVGTMGRKAGHLALGIGKAAGATLTLIPEEFSGRYIPMARIVDTLVGAIIKRLSYGRMDGVALLALGLVSRLDPAEVKRFAEVDLEDPDGLRDAQASFVDHVKREVDARLAQFGIRMTITVKNIGYELRCADPIPYDLEYTRDLGYCASKYLLEGGAGAVITTRDGSFHPLPFEDLIDPASGRTRIRLVDIHTEAYKIARRYMLRLRRDDFDDPHELENCADVAGITVEEFRRQFEPLVADEPPPLQFDR